jgi:hypothetical protein
LGGPRPAQPTTNKKLNLCSFAQCVAHKLALFLP